MGLAHRRNPVGGDSSRLPAGHLPLRQFLEKLVEKILVIVTAGLPRTPGLSRDDLLEANAKAVKEASLAIRTRASEAIVIVVSNPLDAMCHVVSRHSGLPRPRVVGMAGMLDSARFRYLVARELDVSVESTFALVLDKITVQV